jgi:hypothetical protein
MNRALPEPGGEDAPAGAGTTLVYVGLDGHLWKLDAGSREPCQVA